MLLAEAGCAFITLLLHVTGTLGQANTICALKGSSVNLTCLAPPSSRIKWYTVSSNKDRLNKLFVDGNRLMRDGDKSTLTINDLTEKDSNIYWCGHTNGSQWNRSHEIGLHVTDLKVEKIEMKNDGRTSKLNCSTSCAPTGLENTFKWNKITDDLDPDYSYYCFIEGHKALGSPAVCVLNDRCWKVNYARRRICALQGSSVDISSYYSLPTRYNVTNFFWHTDKDMTPLENATYKDRLDYINGTEMNHTLRIRGLDKTDSGVYEFRFLSDDKDGKYSGVPGVTLNVTALKVRIAPNTTVKEGKKVTLTCITSCPLTSDPTFVWKHNTRALEPSKESQSSRLVLNSVRSPDAGNYSCAVKDQPGLSSPEQVLTVIYPPRTPSVSASPSGGLREGSSVTLTCHSVANPPVQGYIWYKEDDDSPKATTQNYTISTISSEETGKYYCQAQNPLGATNSTSQHITLADKLEAKYAAIGTILVGLILLLLVLCLWMRKRSSSTSHMEPEQFNSCQVSDNISAGAGRSAAAAERRESKTQEELVYASVVFSPTNKQEAHLSSSVTPPLPENENVLYSAVKRSEPTTAPGPSQQVDLSELYSTVNKTSTV